MFRESPQPEIPKSFYPNIGQSFRLVIRLILITIPLSIPYAIFIILNEEYALPYGRLLTSFFMLAAYIISFYIVARLGLKRIRKYDMPEYRLKFNREPYQVILIIALMTIAAAVIVSAITDLLPESEWYKDFISQLSQTNLFAFLTVVVAAPILEEIFFRGVILEGLLKNYSPVKAITWSALVFAISHLNPWQSTGAFFLGLVIGWVYWKSNSIIPGMVIHFVNNLVGYLMLINVGGIYESFNMSMENKAVYAVVLLIALGIFILTWRWLNKRWTSPQAKPALS